MPSRPLRLGLLTLLALTLASCVSAVDPKLEQNALFQNGYNDGCATAKARSKVFDRTVVRDEDSYAKEDLYHRGWNKGFRDCGSAATEKDPYSEPAGGWQPFGGSR